MDSGVKPANDVKEEDVDDEESEGHSEDDTTAAVKNEEIKSHGWDFEQLRHDLFTISDIDGNSILERIERNDTKGTTSADIATVREKAMKCNANNPPPKTLNDNKRPSSLPRETPLPRINCATAIRNNTLYIYGGLLEVGDREVRIA